MKAVGASVGARNRELYVHGREAARRNRDSEIQQLGTLRFLRPRHCHCQVHCRTSICRGGATATKIPELSSCFGKSYGAELSSYFGKSYGAELSSYYGKSNGRFGKNRATAGLVSASMLTSCGFAASIDRMCKGSRRNATAQCAMKTDLPVSRPSKFVDNPIKDMELEPLAITPLPVPRVSDLTQFGGDHRERLYWGTYRPFAYLGIRARTPESVIAGLMWNAVKDGKDVLRHYCEDSDDLTRWSWLRHDGSAYGRQVLVDHGLVVTTYFLKSSEPGSGYGGDWVVRVKVEEDESAKTNENSRTQSIFFYVGEEGGKTVNVWAEHDEASEDAPFASTSANEKDEIGGWQMHVKYKKEIKMNYAGLRQLQMSNLTQLVQNTLEKNAAGRCQLSDKCVNDSNVAIVQLAGVVPFEADIVFVSGVNNEEAHVQRRVENLTGTNLDKIFAKRELAFENRFQMTFNLQEKVDGEKELETGRVALSNMLGGIGYFYGQTRVAIPSDCRGSGWKEEDHLLYWRTSLYTAVPSRSTFPRGFLWDEGFHQLLISRWDRNMSLEIIANWFDLINVHGWIPREQVLGDEALSKIPPLYVNQHTDNANPPAFLLVLRGLAKRFEEDEERGQATPKDREFFSAIFPRAAVWFDWFNNTQSGKEPDSYYWHGRDTYKLQELNPKVQPQLSENM